MSQPAIAVSRSPIIAVAGLDFEARAARGPNVTVIYGQDRVRLVQKLDVLASCGARGILSFGTAGGLAPAFKPGDTLIAASIVTATRHYATCPDWCRSLLLALPSARFAHILGVNAPILTVADKAALWEATGAAAVDMKSHIAAEIAARHGIPFAALRVVIDPAHRAVPSIAMAGVRPDGKTDARAIIQALTKEPGQLRALLRLARDARKATRSLLRSRETLGPLLGLLDTGKLALDVQ